MVSWCSAVRRGGPSNRPGCFSFRRKPPFSLQPRRSRSLPASSGQLRCAPGHSSSSRASCGYCGWPGLARTASRRPPASAASPAISARKQVSMTMWFSWATATPTFSSARRSRQTAGEPPRAPRMATGPAHPTKKARREPAITPRPPYAYDAARASSGSTSHVTFTGAATIRPKIVESAALAASRPREITTIFSGSISSVGSKSRQSPPR